MGKSYVYHFHESLIGKNTGTSPKDAILFLYKATCCAYFVSILLAMNPCNSIYSIFSMRLEPCSPRAYSSPCAIALSQL